jgi:hypothetical protein
LRKSKQYEAAEFSLKVLKVIQGSSDAKAKAQLKFGPDGVK